MSPETSAVVPHSLIFVLITVAALLNPHLAEIFVIKEESCDSSYDSIPILQLNPELSGWGVRTFHSLIGAGGSINQSLKSPSRMALFSGDERLIWLLAAKLRLKGIFRALMIIIYRVKVITPVIYCWKVIRLADDRLKFGPQLVFLCFYFRAFLLVKCRIFFYYGDHENFKFEI